MLKGFQTSTHYIIKQLPKATVFINKRHEIVFVSDKWLKDFGFYDHDVIGKNIFSLLGRASKECRLALKKCLQGASVKVSAERGASYIETQKYYESTFAPWYDEAENIVGAIVQTEDVSDRVQTELQLEKREILLNKTSEIAKIGNWEYDAVKDKLIWCNKTKAIHEVTSDYEPQLEDAINFYKLGYSRNTISMAVDNAMRDGTPWNEKLQIITEKGSEKWVVAGGKPIFKDNKFIGLIGTIQDITEHVITKNKTKESEHLLRTLIDNLPLNVYMKDTESRKILVNKHERKFYGLDNDRDIIGKDDFSFLDYDCAVRSLKDDQRVMNTMRPMLDKENVVTKKDGTTLTFLTSKIPLLNDDEEVIGLIGFSLNISHLKQKEEELKNLISVTSLQNKKLINFAHIVSHNLRSHTANFSMLLNFLIAEKDEDEKQKIIGMLTDSSNNLLETLENLNDVVAISTNTNLEKKPVTLNEKITSVQQTIHTLLASNDATIINSISDDIKVKVIPSYLESILMNFMTNAVKYKSPERAPIIKMSAKSKNGHTIVSIEDNGLGMDLKKYGSKLFGMYKTFHSNKDAKGMGLYITKNQIEAMGGKVMVCSEEGRGTIFSIYFDENN